MGCRSSKKSCHQNGKYSEREKSCNPARTSADADINRADAAGEHDAENQKNKNSADIDKQLGYGKKIRIRHDIQSGDSEKRKEQAECCIDDITCKCRHAGSEDRDQTENPENNVKHISSVKKLSGLKWRWFNPSGFCCKRRRLYSACIRRSRCSRSGGCRRRIGRCCFCFFFSLFRPFGGK